MLKHFQPDNTAASLGVGDVLLDSFVHSDWTSHLPASVYEVFDVIGVGDTVIATMASEHSYEQAMYFDSVTAGWVVEKPGTASVSADEVNGVISAMGENVRQSCGVVRREQMISIARKMKTHGHSFKRH